MDCEACGREFSPKRADARFCSDNCRKRLSRTNSPDRIIPDTVIPDTAEAMLARADELSREQMRLRGTRPWTGLDGKPSKIPGPYQATPENESRAREILTLRRAAARM